jgi:hypothetical protein
MTAAPSCPPLLPMVRLFGSRPPWLIGVFATLVLGLAGSPAILIGIAQDIGADRLYRSAIQLWTNSAATGYALGILLYDTRRLTSEYARLRPFLRDVGELDDPDLFRRNRHPLALALVTLSGLAYGLFFNYSTEGLFYELAHGITPAWEYAWGPIMLVVLWTTVFHALWILFDNAWLLGRLARHHVTVDLHRLGIMDVFGHAGIRYLLLMIVGLTVLPIQAILAGRMKPVDFVPTLAIVLPVGLIMLVLPIFGAHRAIAAARDRELARIDGLLDVQAPGSDRLMLLTLYRHRVESTPAWPLSLRNLAQIVLYLVLPPLAWVAAALVQSLVSDAL